MMNLSSSTSCRSWNPGPSIQQIAQEDQVALLGLGIAQIGGEELAQDAIQGQVVPVQIPDDGVKVPGLRFQFQVPGFPFHLRDPFVHGPLHLGSRNPQVLILLDGAPPVIQILA
jgi:hypothetical protein